MHCNSQFVWEVHVVTCKCICSHLLVYVTDIKMLSVKVILVMVQILSSAYALTDVPDIFYPFGDGVEDSILHSNDDESSSLIPIGINLPFFNRSFSSLYVSTFDPTRLIVYQFK